MNYTGSLIDGTVFDTTDGQDLPAYFRVREVIVGWQAALLRMHAGDKYEVFIPAKYGYGSMKLDASFSRGHLRGGSTYRLSSQR